MSLYHGDRGIARVRGDWREDFYGGDQSDASRSSTTTPNPNKERKVKMSYADYKNLKEKGIKPSPRPAQEERKGHARNLSAVSAVSAGTPMSRVSSAEGPILTKRNGVNGSAQVNSVSMERVSSTGPER